MIYEKTKALSVTDELTSLYNRRYLFNRLDEELERAKRYSEHLSLIMIDIDHFKHYNDAHGHLNGDHLLRTLAGLLIDSVRKPDFVARYGGEEFIIVMPEINKVMALKLAERLRKKVETYPFEFQESHPGGKATITIGIAEYPTVARNINMLINKADQALYKGKIDGRNMVTAY